MKKNPIIKINTKILAVSLISVMFQIVLNKFNFIQDTKK